MLRLILIFTLIGYALYKLGLFRFTVRTNIRGQQNSREYGRRAPGGNVNVDSIPNDKKKSEYKGGEYIDYEEVK